MKHTKAQCGITFFVLVLGCLLITGQSAQAGTEWVQKIVSVPYTYYEYEAQTRYRLVRKAFTVTDYRYERRGVTTYRYERRRVAVEVASCIRQGVTRFRYVWKDVRVPETTYEMVRVPYQKTVYKTVRQPYLVRVRVKRTGYRSEVQWVKMYVPDRNKKFTLNLAHNTYRSYRSTSWKYSGSGFTLKIGLGRNNRGDRKYESIRDRDNHRTRRDFSRTVKSRATRKRYTKRGSFRKTRKTRTNRGSDTRRRKR